MNPEPFASLQERVSGLYLPLPDSVLEAHSDLLVFLKHRLETACANSDEEFNLFKYSALAVGKDVYDKTQEKIQELEFLKEYRRTQQKKAHDADLFK